MTNYIVFDEYGCMYKSDVFTKSMRDFCLESGSGIIVRMSDGKCLTHEMDGVEIWEEIEDKWIDIPELKP
jgi:hypothetical protein